MPLEPDFGWLDGIEPFEDRWLLYRAQYCLTGQAFGLGDHAVTAGLAVSGGSDSMAMLHLMARAAPHCGITLEVATVDHRLRPEAAGEAAFVSETCRALGLKHDTLVWDDHPAAGNLMQEASRARYALLAAWAHDNAIPQVLIAHTADDQAESFLIGLSRAAGLDGLSGMRPAWEKDGIAFRRPFLMQRREELRDYLRRHGLAWRDDPSNENTRYTRVKARRALKALKPLGITVGRLNETIHNLAMVQSLVAGALSETFHRIGREAAGSLILNARDFRGLGPEMQRRLLVAAIRWLSGARHPPRAEAVDRLQHALWPQKAATLGGCRFRFKEGALHIAREPRAVSAPCPSGEIWDHRWQLTGPHAPDLEIRALGAGGLPLCEAWRETGHSREALIVSPAVWRGTELVAAPLACPEPGDWQASLSPSFGSFILSH